MHQFDILPEPSAYRLDRPNTLFLNEKAVHKKIQKK